MPAQFLLNVFIAILWMLLIDEDEIRASTFITGFIVGAFIIFFMHRFFNQQFYLRRLVMAVKLILIFIYEIFTSSIIVLKQILSPKLNLTPGIISYKTELTTAGEVTTLALLLTLTPGSVVMEVSPDENILYIHAIDVENSKEFLFQSLKKFEKTIMEVTR